MSSESNKANSEATPSPTKKQDKAPIAELKNGKVLFKQKPLSFEKQSETMQEIVRLREALEELVNQKASPLPSFPEEHRPLIAKLAHESDKSLTILAKNIHAELMPSVDNDDEADTLASAQSILPVSLVEDAITSTLTRQNYGIDAPLGVKVPQALCVWRWEARSDYMHWLPKNSQDKALSRQAERVQAKEILSKSFDALSQEERDALLGSKSSSKLKELLQTNGAEVVCEDSKASPQKQAKKKAEDENTQDQKSEKSEKPKKAVDPEKAAKEKERLEKKNARLEKERKEKEAQSKSKNLMANFFGKAKAQAKPKTSESPKAGPSNQRSEFEIVFRPFALQKDRVLAPTNYFREKKIRPTINVDSNIIVIEDEARDVIMSAPQPSQAELESMPVASHLRSVVSSLPPSLDPKRLRKPHHPAPSLQWKVHSSLCVRELMSRLSEVEVTGEDNAVRSILKVLEDRNALPAKVFIFHEDTRPGYFGTWTKSSRVIGPRSPFAKDGLALDYTCDSGTEWEEEPQGEDVAAADEDEDGEEEEEDSDLDDWLVDDDEVPEVLPDDRAFSPPPLLDFYPPPSGPKRKADDGEKKQGKKRRVVVPLVAFAKGPCYESTVGQVPYEPFKPFAIQFFNDTPFPIDPFTFTSTCLEDYKASLQQPASQPTVSASNDTTFVIPAVPTRLTASSDAPAPSSTSNGGPAPKRLPVAKTPFPEAHLPFLLNKIETVQATSITSLVEAIYLELREHKVKKVAIEAKVREVGEKCKEKKYWVVKPVFKQAAPTQPSAGPASSS